MNLYDKKPTLQLNGYSGQAWQTYERILKQLKSKVTPNSTIVIDMYHGVDEKELYDELVRFLDPTLVIHSEDAKLKEEDILKLIEHELSDDRVFGSLSTRTLDEFFDPSKILEFQNQLKETEGVRVIYGVGASLIAKGDIHIFVDITRWEVQLRYRSGLDNWGAGNYDEDILRKYKRAYFIEWRVFDRHKMQVLKDVDYVIDAHEKGQPKMMTKQAFDGMMNLFSSRPFRLVPYFDEGVWGGTWMEDVCQLEKSDNNYAWCFDGVPEENSIRARVDDVELEFPAMNLVKTNPIALLGEKVFARFGAEFPIRFDFLDTINGGNLSLQVHPLTEYIHDHFGMSYTQDESYYILDAQENANVYLGVKEGVTKDTLIPALHRASDGSELFDDSKYINKFPVKKHDHILIPAGTIHGAGSGTMVLEISATPYIFTFKLWDWGRVGLDGKPRPINVDRGAENIRFERDTQWCKENLVSNIQELSNEEHLKVERTGLHELEFIETRRYWFDEETKFTCNESVNMLNLIEGEEAIVTFDGGSYVVHYAETFIVPESVKEYTIKPSKNDKIAVICARVRV